MFICLVFYCSGVGASFAVVGVVVVYCWVDCWWLVWCDMWLVFLPVVYLVMRIWRDCLFNSVDYFNSFKLKCCGFVLRFVIDCKFGADCLLCWLFCLLR